MYWPPSANLQFYYTVCRFVKSFINLRKGLVCYIIWSNDDNSLVSGVRSQNVCLLRLVLQTHIAIIYIRLLDNLFGSIHDTSARDDIHAYFMNMYYTQVNTTSVTSVGHYKWIITVSWTTFRTNCKCRYNLGPVSPMYFPIFRVWVKL